MIRYLCSLLFVVSHTLNGYSFDILNSLHFGCLRIVSRAASKSLRFLWITLIDLLNLQSFFSYLFVFFIILNSHSSVELTLAEITRIAL